VAHRWLALSYAANWDEGNGRSLRRKVTFIISMLFEMMKVPCSFSGRPKAPPEAPA
jgi:hypothetical protein